jgi:hypothetical protein
MAVFVPPPGEAVKADVRDIISRYMEAIIANRPAAYRALAEPEHRVEVCPLKGGLMRVVPQERQCFLMLDFREARPRERHGLAPPFFPAAVAEKAEREVFHIGMVGYFFRDRSEQNRITAFHRQKLSTEPRFCLFIKVYDMAANP